MFRLVTTFAMSSISVTSSLGYFNEAQCQIAESSIGHVPSTDQTDPVWEGNDTLLDDDWFVTWGLVGWNPKLGNVNEWVLGD